MVEFDSDTLLPLIRACRRRERLRMTLNHQLIFSDPWRWNARLHPIDTARSEMDLGPTYVRTTKPGAGNLAAIELRALRR